MTKKLHLKVSNSSCHVKHYKNLNPLSANPTKWSNTLKEFVDNSWLLMVS